MKTSDLMKEEVVFVFENANLGEVIDILVKRRINGLPVVDKQQRIVGIVTEGDIIARTEIFDRDFDLNKLLLIPIAEIMTTHPITIMKENDIQLALSIFAATNIKQLPVVENDRLVGILARKDLIKGILKR